MRIHQFIPGCLGGLLLLILAGCGTRPEVSTEDAGSGQGKPITVTRTFSGKYPIHVVCTTGMVADLVSNVGGDHVKVAQLMGEGVDPHLYKASPGDVSMLSTADIIFYSGRNLEGKMGDLFVRMARTKPTFAVTDAIEDQYILEDAEKHFDPHLWFDVELWSKGVDVVRDALSAFDPPHAGDYTGNAAAYRKNLVELHEYAKSEIARIQPKQQRVLVTAHDAFQYFGKAYDIKVLGIQGISTEDEAGVKRINELVDFIVQNKIKAVFIETSVSEKNIRALVEGCAARDHKVVIGGELFSDAMGKPGTPDGTYEGMIRHNVDTIVKALK